MTQRPKAERKNETITTRVTAEQREQIALVAERLDITESQFMRRAVVQALAQQTQQAA